MRVWSVRIRSASSPARRGALRPPVLDFQPDILNPAMTHSWPYLSVLPTARVAQLIVPLSARVQETIGRIPLKFGRNSPALRWLIAINLARELRELSSGGCSGRCSGLPRPLRVATSAANSPKPALCHACAVRVELARVPNNRGKAVHGTSIHLSHAGSDQDLSDPQGAREHQPVVLSG